MASTSPSACVPRASWDSGGWTGPAAAVAAWPATSARGRDGEAGNAQNEAAQVVGANTVILFGFTGQFGEFSAPGIVTRALAAGTTCTLTAAGAPGSLEPVEPPVTFPVVIVNG